MEKSGTIRLTNTTYSIAEEHVKVMTIREKCFTNATLAKICHGQGGAGSSFLFSQRYFITKFKIFRLSMTPHDQSAPGLSLKV